MSSLAQTSRDNILDAIELIANLGAIPSHVEEKLRELRKDFELGGQEQTQKQIQNLEFLVEETLKIRRNYMTQLVTELSGNTDYWCLAKHIILAYGLSQELLQSNYNTQNKEFYIKSADQIFEQLLISLGLFLNLEEMPTCARCLSDATKEKREKTQS